MLASSINFFYLLSSGVSFFKELDCILAILVFLIVIIKYRNFLIKNCSKYFLLIEIWTILLTITSTIQAYFRYDQPIYLGLQAQREFFIMPLILFSYYMLYKLGKVSKNGLLVTLYLFTTIEMIFGFIHVYLFNGTLLNVGGGTRYMETRAFMNVDYIIFLCIYSLNAFFRKEKKWYLIYLIFALLFVTFITKWRMVILSLIISLVFSSLFLVKLSVEKKFVLFLVIMIFTILFFQLDIGKDIITAILNKGVTSTSEIRDTGRNFYISVLKDNILFGGGYVNTKWDAAVRLSRMTEGLLYVDNGIFGFAFVYGSIGVMYIFTIYFIVLKKGFNLYLFQKKNIFYFISYVIYFVIGCYTIVTGMTNSFFIAIILLLLEIELDQAKSQKVLED